MELNLNNKTALVCAGSQGLGLASALELSKLGANVVLAARNEENLALALNQLDTAQGQKHCYISTDFNNYMQAVSDISSKISSSPHIIVTNGGGPPSGRILDLTAEDFQTGFNQHFKFYHELIRWGIPFMKSENFGRIINVLSLSIVRPIIDLPVSNVIRAGLENWAKTLTLEVAEYGITVNNVLPGYTQTDRLTYLFEKQAEAKKLSVEDITNSIIQKIPAKRMGQPSEFGAVVAFLASPAASYVNGVSIPIDGGAVI